MAPVLGADTVVCTAYRIYGKLPDADHARATLCALSGWRPAVIGGICLIEDGHPRTATATRTVRFRTLTDELIELVRRRAGRSAVQQCRGGRSSGTSRATT